MTYIVFLMQISGDTRELHKQLQQTHSENEPLLGNICTNTRVQTLKTLTFSHRTRDSQSGHAGDLISKIGLFEHFYWE